ncbi:MAG: dicarboxylate/amino acid:cation symporter, partial [Methylocystis sp.]|nr:dicarboxylate/amino acid:cation symporter [Methylocystis sp.]
MAPEQTDQTRAPGWWRGTPLYLRIIGAVALGVITGVTLGPGAEPLQMPAKIVLRLLGALAPPLILLAITQALMRTHLGGAQALRLVTILLTNTLVAIGIGLAVANVLRPGEWIAVSPAPAPEKSAAAGPDPLTQFLDNVPRSIAGPF